MSFKLTHKTILITGATDGLGKLLSLELCKQNANVIIHGRSQSKIDQTIKELQALTNATSLQGILCDLNDPTSIQKAFSGLKKLDVLINNAGIWLEGNTIDANPARIIELVNVNLAAPLVITRTVLPLLLASEFGQVLNVSSIAGVEIPAGMFYTTYSATKFGLQAFTEAMAKEFDNTNLRFMGYYPGGMETKIFEKAGNEYKTHEPWMFNPQESVEAMLFMLTRDSKINIKRMDLINHLQK